MNILPTDTIVYSEKMGSGIIMRVLENEGTYLVSFQGKELYIPIYGIIKDSSIYKITCDIKYEEELKHNTNIVHKKYGTGIILSKEKGNNLYRAKFDDGIYFISGKNIIFTDSKESESMNIKGKKLKDTRQLQQQPKIDSGDFVFHKDFGSGLVIRKVENGTKVDVKFGRQRIILAPNELQITDYKSQDISNNYFINKKKQATAIRQKKDFLPGEQVYHQAYGHGTIIEKVKDGYMYSVMFGDTKIYVLEKSLSRDNNDIKEIKDKPLIQKNRETTNGILSNSKHKNILVRFSNGTTISNDNAEETYIDALWEFDPDSIMLNHISYKGISIITPHNTKDGRVQVGVEQWAYIPSTSNDMIKVLHTISEALKIEVEIREIQ